MAGGIQSWFGAVIVAGALLLAGAADAAAGRDAGDDRRGINNFLTENTLAWPDEKGERNLMHFGRFGNFDWYFPCQFESGYWSLADDLVLSLTFDNRNYPPRTYQLDRRGDALTLTDPKTGRVAVAELLEGSHIPFF